MLLSWSRTKQVYVHRLKTGGLLVQDAQGGWHIPSLYKIQQVIDSGRAQGYDVIGRALRGGNIAGTRRFLHYRDIMVFFRSAGIRCDAWTFRAPTGQFGTHPEVMAFCEDHFSNPNSPDPVPLLLLVGTL